jgi:hypothetical protein
VKRGVIDPAKVVRTPLQDAASVADLLITTEAMVAEKPKKKAPAAPPGAGGMGDMFQSVAVACLRSPFASLRNESQERFRVKARAARVGCGPFLLQADGPED